MPNEVKSLPLTSLRLDTENPRLGEFGVNAKSGTGEILAILWKTMAIDELMYSIVANGFWTFDPLIAIADGTDYLVIEGNRRLAALLLIHDQTLINDEIPVHITERINDELITSTNTVPVIVVASRKEVWQFIGFKHLNGPAKWGSFAKAQYIGKLKTEGIPLATIAFNIGDTNKTVQRLYQGLRVLEQAETANIFDRSDIHASRLYFSHLYTGLQREGIKGFLGLEDAEVEADLPVREDRIDNLKELLLWLYGSKSDAIQPIVKSQNPDLGLLDRILGSKESIAALRSGANLNEAFRLSRSAESVFEEFLLAAKRSLQSAKGYVDDGYDGNEEMLRIAGSVAGLSDSLYVEMERKNTEVTRPQQKVRLTEE